MALAAVNAAKNAKLGSIKIDMVQQAEALEATDVKAKVAPVRVQNLVAQAGILRGSLRTCTAFKDSAQEIRTAWHCVKGISAADLRAWTFVDTLQQAFAVVSIKSVDAQHDSAILNVDHQDSNFQELYASPDRLLPVRLLAYDPSSGAVSLSGECHIKSIDLFSGELRHDCNSMHGSSGGALIQNGMIVGMHLGSVHEKQRPNYRNPAQRTLEPIMIGKIAVMLRSGQRRAMEDFSVYDPEYDCASDCSAFTHIGACLRNPFKKCSFGAAASAACEIARSASCTSNAAEAALGRLKSSLNAETNRIGSSIYRVTDELDATASRVRQKRDLVGSLNAGIGSAHALINNLSAKTAEFEKATRDAAASFPGVRQVLEVAKHTEEVARNERDAASIEASRLGDQLEAERKVAAAALLKVEELKKSVAQADESLAAAGKDLSTLRTKVATNAAVLTIAEAIKQPARNLGKELENDLRENGLNASIFQNAAKIISKDMATFFHVAAVDLVDTYRLTRNPKSILDGNTNETPPIPDMSYILNQKMCLQRANERADTYRKDIETLRLSTWPKKMKDITLGEMALASRTLSAHSRSLKAGVAEIALNTSCAGLGIEQPLNELLTDATEWSDWVNQLRLSYLAATIK